MTGGHGWGWIACTRRSNPTPQDTVGLRASARKLQNTKCKLFGGSEGRLSTFHCCDVIVIIKC